MKASIDQATLSTALKNFHRIAKAAETFTMGIKFSFVSTGLWLFATDLEIGLKSRIDCEVSEPGEFCLDRKVYEIIKNFPKGKVQFTQNKKRLTIFSGSIKYNFFPLEKDPPTIDFQEEKNEAFIPILEPQLEEILSSVLFASGQKNGQEDSQEEGVFFHPKEEGPLIVFGTDGKQLAFLKTGSKNGFDKTICVSRKSLFELAKLYNRAENVCFTITKSHFIFRFDHTFLALRLIDTLMPDYDAALNCKISGEITVNRQLLISALKRVVVASDSFFSFSATFECIEDRLNILVEGPLVVFSETFEMKSTGQLKAFSLNCKWLLGALCSMHSEEIVIQQSDSEGPILFTEPNRTNYTYLLARIVI